MKRKIIYLFVLVVLVFSACDNKKEIVEEKPKQVIPEKQVPKKTEPKAKAEPYSVHPKIYFGFRYSFEDKEVSLAKTFRSKRKGIETLVQPNPRKRIYVKNADTLTLKYHSEKEQLFDSETSRILSLEGIDYYEKDSLKYFAEFHYDPSGIIYGMKLTYSGRVIDKDISFEGIYSVKEENSKEIIFSLLENKVKNFFKTILEEESFIQSTFYDFSRVIEKENILPKSEKCEFLSWTIEKSNLEYDSYNDLKLANGSKVNIWNGSLKGYISYYLRIKKKRDLKIDEVIVKDEFFIDSTVYVSYEGKLSLTFNKGISGFLLDGKINGEIPFRIDLSDFEHGFCYPGYLRKIHVRETKVDVLEKIVGEGCD